MRERSIEVEIIKHFNNATIVVKSFGNDKKKKIPVIILQTNYVRGHS